MNKRAVAAIVLGSYFAVGVILDIRAARHLKNPLKAAFIRWAATDPDLYTAEGNRLREIATRYYVVGGLIVVLVLAGLRFI